MLSTSSKTSTPLNVRSSSSFPLSVSYSLVFTVSWSASPEIVPVRKYSRCTSSAISLFSAKGTLRPLATPARSNRDVKSVRDSTKTSCCKSLMSAQAIPYWSQSRAVSPDSLSR